MRSELDGARCSQRGENLRTLTWQLVRVFDVCIEIQNVAEYQVNLKALYKTELCRNFYLPQLNRMLAHATVIERDTETEREGERHRNRERERASADLFTVCLPSPLCCG